ncbi:hypothetical protein LJY25_00050 [Hymenobacter sp. BT175]|uniref:hypothetical protein n=1 Tax=Hymenobacter translucens TaxID=2886507 RepID=UPI001D0E616C|nr:hypothetical protein [Hymenobacter translucens]MCC2544820.1 hypothetical protein [Hymenobacter translucens]
MTETERKNIDTSLEQVRKLHANISQLWDAETTANFYYQVLSGTIARNGPDVAKAITEMLNEQFDNTRRAHSDLGRVGLNISGKGGSGMNP